MMDKLTSKERSENMRRIQSKGMKPEMIVRRIVHSMGFRYRLHKSDLPGRPDLVFASRKKVIFVNGCFWHQHQSSRCKIARFPKSNKEYWIKKLENNVARDKKNKRKLKRDDWEVMTIWECQVCDTEKLKRRIKKFLDA